MKNIKRPILTLIILIIVSAIVYWFANKDTNINMNSITNNYIIDFSELNEKVYCSARTWGITGNHEEIILSTSPISNKHRLYSKDDCFIFYTSEIYYKIENMDTLLIYAGSSTIAKPPKNYSNKRIKIVINKLKTYDELKDYKKNYNKYGLKKISVYKED